MHTTLNEILVQLKLESYNYSPNTTEVLLELQTKGLSI